MKNSNKIKHVSKANSNQQSINALERLPKKEQSAEITMLIKYMRSDGKIDSRTSRQLLSFLDTIVEEIDRLKAMRVV